MMYHLTYQPISFSPYADSRNIAENQHLLSSSPALRNWCQKMIRRMMGDDVVLRAVIHHTEVYI
jgi:hypothetical protein